MKIPISEDIIDRSAEELGQSEVAYEKALSEIKEKQPVILSYLFTENFEAFTQEEKEFMLFMLLVIWKSVRYTMLPIPNITEESLSKAEEANWLKIQGMRGSFRQKLDAFFEKYPQEDLLAFVEDALSEDQEEETSFVTKEAQEHIFITMKTVIDCLLGIKS